MEAEVMLDLARCLSEEPDDGFDFLLSWDGVWLRRVVFIFKFKILI